MLSLQFEPQTLLQLPHMLKAEPMKVATGQALEVLVGDALPDISIVVMNGYKQSMKTVHYAKVSDRV